ncbi:FlgD immunoglobulin-like domain containing protein [Rubrivirga sp. IMCC43871]|uniref:FlgD immunoglobulin-like domain containing protein n=1 Tax=Rubrivirga sp. IMCC43871 TaxID=3391575 RepID=UPI0039901B9F
MMRALSTALLAALAVGASAQTVETGTGPVSLFPEGARSDVFVLDAQDGVLRAGPLLIEIAPNGTVSVPSRDNPVFDPPTTLDARAYTIEARGDVVAVGLGFKDTTADAERPPDTAAGYAISTDGGRSYTYRFAALDQSRDSTVTYGISTLPAFPATISQGAAPLDLALSPGADTLYSATLYAGLRRSTNDGATWERVVLPPDSLFVLDPRESYDFLYNPDVRQPIAFIDGNPDLPVFAEFSENFVSLSVLVDEAGTVWAGTNGGLNRSVRVPGATDFAWLRYTDALIGGALPGNQVIALETRPIAGGRDEVWAVCRVSSNPFTAAEEEPGIAVWRGDDADGRAIFETVLVGVVASDLAFDDARVYAATSDGLHVSEDDGKTWRVVRTFRRPDGTPLPLASAGVAAVATTPGTVWVGTASGLLKSTDGARTWELFRADVRPGAPGDGSRTVDVYAYPNPFNPRNGDLRVRLDLDAGSDVTVRVFDQAMNLVRTLDAPGRPPGPNEVFWDGQTDGGLRVANGAYIYTVEAAGERYSGRILVIQ